MRILNLYVYALKNYANFKGRACRMEAISFMLFYTLFKIIILLSLTLPTLIRRAGLYNDFVPIFSIIFFVGSLIAFIAHIVPAWAVGARRLHDLNLSGWLQLFLFIPYVNIIANLVFLVLFYFIKGSDEENSFGSVSENY